ncbi:MAG: glycosyltransferase family 4 protein, partial [Desulfofundulus sp.]
ERAIAISRETRDYLEHEFGVPSNKIRVIYNGVDEQYFRPPTERERMQARQELGVRAEDYVASLIGRLERVKGHDVLINALAKLRKMGLDVVALLAGSGSEADTIRRLAVEAGVSDLIRLVGYVDSRLVLWASDVSVLPSRQEGFPLVVVEAMMCGVVPIRTPAAGAFDQIEDGVNEFIVPFDDPETLALRMKQVLEDAELRMRLSAAAIESARQRFCKRQMVDNTTAVYEEALISSQKV